MAVVAVLLSHIDRNAVVTMKPNINLTKIKILLVNINIELQKNTVTSFPVHLVWYQDC